jgi:hypothetical protein
VHYRPLAFVSVLTVGDYLLWNWSLQGGHDVTALVSGMTLPPLAIALIWLCALNLLRLLARTTRRPRRAGAGRRTLRRRPARAVPHTRPGAAPTSESSLTDRQEEQAAASSKLAA